MQGKEALMAECGRSLLDRNRTYESRIFEALDDLRRQRRDDLLVRVARRSLVI